MRLELDSFLQWVDDHLYVTVAEAKTRADLHYDEWRYVEQRVTRAFADFHPDTAFFIDLLHCECIKRCMDESSEPYPLYKVFRRRVGTTPVSLPVLVDLRMLCCCDVVRRVVKTRVRLSDEDKKRIADKAVAEAEAALREQHVAKRRKTMH